MLELDRPAMRICFVTPRFPFPTTKGDTLRAYNQIRELSRSHSVHLIAATDMDIPHASLRELRRYCSGIDIVKISRVRSYATIAALGLQSRLPLQVLYFLAPEFRTRVERVLRAEPFDVVHAMTIRAAPAAFAATDVPVVIDFMDSFAANISTRRERVKPLARRVYDLELARVAAYERYAAQRAAGGFVIAQLDRDAIGDSRLAVIPNGVDNSTFAYHEGARDDATLIFTGNMGYQPNVDAVHWFATECWPGLHKHRPELRFQIVGARPAPAVLALGRVPGIEVTGPVQSMVPYLHRATVAVCPIRCGSGMQNKLLEAMATGVPVVTTEFANRGVGAGAGRDIQIGSSAEQFSAAVSALLADPALRIRQARSAQTFVRSTYSWARHAAALVAQYREAIDAFSPDVRDRERTLGA